jgi:hypothetical protein
MAPRPLVDLPEGDKKLAETAVAAHSRKQGDSIESFVVALTTKNVRRSTPRTGHTATFLPRALVSEIRTNRV